MPFSRSNLRPDEDLVLDTRPHWWFITPAAIALAAAFLFGAIVLVNGTKGLVGEVPVLAGILVPSAGKVTVGGLDATSDPDALRRKVGFLPEDPPLYREMRVGEFLVWCGRIKGLFLESSRLDTTVHSDAAWSYTEWTMEFRNDSRQQREARAQLLLPPGGAVPRPTLWVHGSAA